MSRILLPLAIVAALVGCGGDADDDGLNNRLEKKNGTDPDIADSDGDGLSDFTEVEGTGTDPLVVDSDGDGYRDGDEVAEGSDPRDAESWIYQGGWPYNPAKAAIAGPTWEEGERDEGEIIPDLVALDQFGDTVHLYDFAHQGKPILFDLSEDRCAYCDETAKMLEGRANWFEATYPEAGYGRLKDLVDNGDIYWVTVIDGDFRSGGNDYEDDALRWFELYPNPHVPVLWDENEVVYDYIGRAGVPQMMLLEEDMTISDDASNYMRIWDALLDRFPE